MLNELKKPLENPRGWYKIIIQTEMRDRLRTLKEDTRMTITRKMDGTTLEIAVEGKLDTMTSPELSEEIEKGLLDGAEYLLWDFSKLEYISSAGIRVLLAAANKLEDPDKMKVENSNEVVKMAFILTGLGDLLLDAY